MESEPPHASAPDGPAGLPAPVRVLLLVFALPLIIVGLLLLVAAVRDISAAPMAVLVIAIAQIIAGGAMALAAARASGVESRCRPFSCRWWARWRS